jgi:hypothetical protein
VENPEQHRVHNTQIAWCRYNVSISEYHLSFFGKVKSLISKFLVESRDGGLRITVIFRKPLLAFPAVITAWLVFVFGLTYGMALTSGSGIKPELIVLGAAAFIIAALLWIGVLIQPRFAIKSLRKHILNREQMECKKFFGRK